MKLLESCSALVLLVLATPALAAVPDKTADTIQDCHIGSYRLTDGSVVDIAPDTAKTFFWRRFDGEMGKLHEMSGDTWTSTLGSTDEPDGITVSFPNCQAGRIEFKGMRGQRLTFDVQDVSFRSHDVTLRGRLVLPKGRDRVPVLVFVHGSEDASAFNPGMLSEAMQRMMPAEGIGMFIYDKRGTGRSGGVYTQDFNLLADDAVAAAVEARSLAGARLGRVGFFGGSEGGWVAPLAANRTPVDFVVVGYGLAVSGLDEDQEEVKLQMREKGYPPGVISKALEVASAAEGVMQSDFKSGYREYDAIRAIYGKEPWYKDVRGDFAWIVLQQHNDAQLRAMAPKFDWHADFSYDGMSTLRKDTTPQLWILGGEDYEAPSEETSYRIKSLMMDGLPFTLAVYPHADHGILLFETNAKGERVSTRYARGFFEMIRDFVRNGRLGAAYGDAHLTLPCHNRP
jgi:pimeloyl-ACP methyl ester carboxylesterase